VTDERPDEAWGFEWATPDGNGGFVRLALRRAERVAWFWAYLLRPDGGPVVVRDHEVTLPRGAALEIRADSLWSELVCETAGEHWSIGLEAFGVRLDDPDDALHGEIGERIALGFDFEWETTGEPSRSTLGGVEREEQPGTVHGEVLLGRDRIPLDTVGRFEHSIGGVDAAETNRETVAWNDGTWWSVRTDGRDRGVGARWEGGVVHPLEVTAMEIAPEATAVIPLGDRIVTRGVGGAISDELTGIGWTEVVTRPRAKIT
jgi:hypothetical protein